MAMQGQKNRLKRVRIDPDKGFTEGGWFQPIKTGLQKLTHYEYWKSSQTGGKQAFPDGMKHIGGQLGDISPDVLKYIKKFDSENSSGAVKEALDIMTKLQEATMASDLMTSIQPLQNILGNDLYGSMKNAGAQSKAKNKTKNKDKQQDEPDDPIMELIAAAIAMVGEDDPDKAIEAAELLNENEVELIRQAYNTNTQYVSQIEIPEFVDAINQLIPVFKIKSLVTS